MAGVTWWNFYVRLFPGSIRSPQVVEFLSQSAAAHSRQAVSGLGRIAGPSGPSGLGLRARAARVHLVGFLASLRTRTESGGISLVALEASRATELLSQNVWGTEPLRPESVATHAPTSYSGRCLLAAG